MDLGYHAGPPSASIEGFDRLIEGEGEMLPSGRRAVAHPGGSDGLPERLGGFGFVGGVGDGGVCVGGHGGGPGGRGGAGDDGSVNIDGGVGKRLVDHEIIAGADEGFDLGLVPAAVVVLDLRPDLHLVARLE